MSQRVGPPRFYLDSSIWNFAVSDDVPDYRAATDEFLDHAQVFGWRLFISQVVSDEIQKTPEPKRTQIENLVVSFSPERIPLSEEAVALADAYIQAGILSERHRNDCLHVALATVAGCDFLLSWNFRHLANRRRAPRFLAVNTLKGYTGELAILNPLEVYEI